MFEFKEIKSSGKYPSKFRYIWLWVTGVKCSECKCSLTLKEVLFNRDACLINRNEIMCACCITKEFSYDTTSMD